MGTLGVLQKCVVTLENCRDAQATRFEVLKARVTEGPVVRIQPNHISFNTVNAVEDIHGTRTKARKGLMYEITTPPGLTKGLLIEPFTPMRCNLIFRDKARHAHLRRIFQPCFSGSSMTRCAPIVKHYCGKLMIGIQRKAEVDGIVDVDDWFNRFAFDVLTPVLILC